jgi:predicted HTH transcriptional regulator
MYSEGGVVYFHKEAVRKILLNAIVHQDYSSCNPIQISVYEDKMYIWNEGEIPPNLDSADRLFMKHSSKPHNRKPSITNTLQSYHIFEIMTSIILNTVRSISSNCAIRVILSRRIIS